MKTHVRRALVPGIALSVSFKDTYGPQETLMFPVQSSYWLHIQTKRQAFHMWCALFNLPINGYVAPSACKIALSDSVATCIGKLIQLAFGGDRPFDRLMALGCFMTWGWFEIRVIYDANESVIY